MADVNANISLNIDTTSAIGDLRRLQSEISSFNRSLASANSASAASAAALNRALMDGINSTRMFDARMVPVISTVDSFSNSLEKNKLTLGEYTRYASSQLPGLSRIFRNEFNTIDRLARDRLRSINAQYLEFGKTARGVREALQSTPTGLASGAATELALATQRQQIFNKLIDDGSTKLLNWGKNTQWAGRQLMVGFTLPLAALGTAAAQAFMEIDKATVAFERVYGDLSTTTAEMERNKDAVMSLGQEYTKYGIAVSDTIQLSARVAATGLQNNDMITATEQSLRFATLGQIDYNQALDATIALQSAFNVASKDLGSTIDYLNAVENQTILSIEDMSAAIPRVATVIQGLGGDVRDLAVFMTAMREGGVSAENAANALKSGLASLINPTDRAQESMQKLGIDMQAIINTNRGDLLATVSAFGQALSKVDEFSRTQALEQIFGKYQYARMAALFDNIAKSSSQAARAMDLANMSVAELASLSEKELSKIEESTTVKFEAAMERLKLSIAPLGEAFLKGIMPIMDALTSIAEAFNKLPDPVKSAIAVITGIVAGLGPVFLMTIGLIGNGLANLIKGIQFFRKRIAGIKGDADNFEFLAKSELEAKTASEQLEGSVTSLTGALGIQGRAVAALIRQYERYASVAGVTAATAAARGRRGAAAATPPLTMARGGVVPGSGSGDKVPALLEPGETVVTKKASQRYGPVIAAMNAGTLPGFQFGLDEGITGATYSARTRGSAGIERMSQSLQRYLDTVENGQEIQEEINRRLREQSAIKPLTTTQIKTIVREVTQQPDMFSARRAGRRTMGAPAWARAQSRAMEESGQFATEEAFIRARLGGDVSDDMFKIDASHIQKQVDEFGNKVWTASNLFPDFRGVNQTLEARMKSFDSAIQKGTISISDTAAMMRERTPDLLAGLSAEEIEFELDRLRQGLHPVTENATRVATSFAELDAVLSREALAMGAERTALGTRAATGRNAEFFAAAGQYRLGEGREQYFGAGRRSEQRYAEMSQRTAREATNLVDDASDAIDAALERNSPAERVARAGDDMDRGLAEGLRRSASIPVAAARDVADDTARAMDPQEAFKQSQSEQRRTLRQIDLIPQTRARLKQEAMREAAIGGGDRRQQIRAARRTVEEMSDEQILAIIQQEESQRIARERQASAERRATRAKADSSIARERNAEAAAETRAAKARTGAANLRAQQTLKDIAAEAAAGQAYDINTRQQVQGRRGIASRVGGALMKRSGTIGMGLGMASMIPFMGQNDQGQFMGMDANALGMGMAATGMAFDMASLVKLGPVMGIATKAAGALGLSLGGLAAATGGVTLAVGAAVIAYKLWRDSVDNANRAAADLGANLGGTANALNNISEILGKMTPAQSRTQLQLGITSEQMNEEMAQWANMLSEGPGKEFIDELKGATSEERFKKLGDYIRYGIASGAMDVTQARQFADAVALQLDDALLSLRVKAETARQGTGTAAMMALAQGRQSAVSQSEAMRNVDLVLRPGDSFQNTEATFASEVIGSSLQVVQDFANASAIAAAELAAGKIDQAEYEKAVKDSNDAIKISTENMIKAMRATDDLGGTMAAFNDQLVKLGMTAEQAAAISEMSGVGVSASGVGTRANQAQVRAEAGAAAAQGVSYENIQAIYDYMKSDEGKRTVANTFGRLAGTGQAYGAAGLQMSMEQGGIPGLQGGTEAETQKNIERTMEVAIKYIETGGTAAEFQQFIMSIPSEKVMTIQAKYIDPVTGQVTNPQALKKEIDSFNKLLPSLGSEKAYAVTEKAGGEVSQETISAAESLKRVFGDNQEAIDRYINIALNTEPDGLETYLPDITEKLNDLNTKIPPDIQKLIGINLENPEDIDKYGPMADALALLVPIIQNLPADQQTFAAQFVFSAEENGEPVDPITFGKDIAKYKETLDKLRSSKKKVRKEAVVDLITQAYDAQGKKIDPKQAADAMNYMIEELGITEAEFLQLPPDKISKIIEFAVQAKGLEESAATYNAMASAAFAAGDNETGRQYQAAASRMTAAAATAKANAAGAAGAGFAEGGNDLPGGGGGGGGGGEKADPFKDFKAGIVDQIKRFADTGVTLKNLMNAKNDFFNLLKASKGIDDKIRKAGLNPLIAEQLMGMAPEDANKVLGKLTGKGGKQLQDRFIAASISGTMSEAQTKAATAGQQQRVTANLVARGASSQAISAIAADPTKAAEYATLLDKVAKGGAKAEKAIKQYIAQLEKASIAEEAAASATEKAVEFAERRRKIAFIDSARAGGVEQGLIEYIAGDTGLMAEYTVAVQKGDKAVQEFFAKARGQLKQMQMEAYKMNPFEYIAEQANEAMDAIRAQFAPEELRLEDESAAAFESAYGMSKDAAQDLIEKNNVLISQYEQQVNEYERMNAQEQRLIQEHEREKKQWQDKIDSAQDYIDGWQRSIDLLNKQVAERNHQADLLNHELDLMSKAEEQINETYDKRVKALDQVEAVNNRILESQRSQLDISRSLSTGDVYAAAAAAQQMREQQAQQAATDARDALTSARDAQIQGLRSSGGMSREQIEEQLWQINQQNYQTSLEIYALEDKIYQKNQEIYGYKVEIDKIDDSIKEHTDKIWKNNGEILRIQKELISPLQDANAKWTDRLKTSDLQLAYDKDHLMYQGKTLEQYEKQNARMNAHLKQIDGARVLAEGLYDTWLGVGQAIADANKTAKQNLAYAAKGEFKKITGIDYTKFMAEDGTFDFAAFQAEVESLRLSKTQEAINTGTSALQGNYAGGMIGGDGTRDSVLSKLSPGEFVVRKSMVNKYGQAMFEKINQGSFDLPRYSVEGTPNIKPISVSNVSAPVYNNTYSINVPVNQPNASADEIAYKVMTKIKNIDNANIRRVNVY